MPTQTDTADRVRRLLARTRSRKMTGYLAAAVALLVAILGLGHELAHHLRALETWIASLGPWGVVAFVVLLALGTSLLLPESLFGIAAGVLFGLPWGVAAALAGNLLAASLQYALARRLLRERIQRALTARPSLAAIQRAVLGDEVRLQLLVRLTPVNPATISYLLGAAGVRFAGFLLAGLALLPHLVLEVYLGHAGKDVARAAVGPRGAAFHHLELLGGLALAFVAVLSISQVAHKALTRAVARSEAPDGGAGAK